jgi:hypothetical protein
MWISACRCDLAPIIHSRGLSDSLRQASGCSSSVAEAVSLSMSMWLCVSAGRRTDRGNIESGVFVAGGSGGSSGGRWRCAADAGGAGTAEPVGGHDVRARVA